jgi:nucleotidyltransferase/DNA polymerase involved in DNA repair
VKAMHGKQQVAEMATEVLRRQARARVERTGEPFEGALKAVLDTKAGRQLGELRDGPHCDESAERWQEDLAPQRAKERRSQARQEELDRARLVAWESFMRAERRELELRKDGQLARLLGEPLPGEPPAAVVRLASEDKRQAQQGLVALMSSGKVFYKHVEELSEEDMLARIAANRVRTTWLKERQDRWLGRGWSYL